MFLFLFISTWYIHYVKLQLVDTLHAAVILSNIVKTTSKNSNYYQSLECKNI